LVWATIFAVTVIAKTAKGIMVAMMAMAKI
jgi:hypothetical protein